RAATRRPGGEARTIKAGRAARPGAGARRCRLRRAAVAVVRRRPGVGLLGGRLGPPTHPGRVGGAAQASLARRPRSRPPAREGAQVAELTRWMPATFTGWPPGMRIIARRERPHPGAQLHITDHDGWRITVFATNTVGGRLADLEVRHRARAEDRIRG